jgi:cytochrome c oxidase assembly protein subunit 15
MPTVSASPQKSSNRVAGPALVVRFAWLAVFYNVLVVLWGALVRASGSGAGCGNHWPLCNGQVIPVSPGLHTIIEFTHRMMTTGSVVAVLALLVWTLRATVKGQAARGFAIAATALLFNEALLGALLVKLGYVTGNQSVGRMVVLSIHLSNTLLLLAALTLTARMLTTGQGWADLRGARGMGWAIAGLAATIGVGVSGSMAALGDTLFRAPTLGAAFAQDFAAGAPWLLKLRLVHPGSAVGAAVFVVWLVRRAGGGRRSAGRTATFMFALLGMQFALGIADVALLAPAWMQLLHLLGADLYWVALVLLAAEVVWPGASEEACPSLVSG